MLFGLRDLHAFQTMLRVMVDDVDVELLVLGAQIMLQPYRQMTQQNISKTEKEVATILLIG